MTISTPKYRIGQTIRWRLFNSVDNAFYGDLMESTLVYVDYNNREGRFHKPILVNRKGYGEMWISLKEVIEIASEVTLYKTERNCMPSIQDSCYIYNSLVPVSRDPYWWTGRFWVCCRNDQLVEKPERIYYWQYAMIMG